MFDAHAVTASDEWSTFLAELNADLKEVVELLGSRHGASDRAPDDGMRELTELAERLRACG